MSHPGAPRDGFFKLLCKAALRANSEGLLWVLLSLSLIVSSLRSPIWSVGLVSKTQSSAQSIHYASRHKALSRILFDCRSEREELALSFSRTLKPVEKNKLCPGSYSFSGAELIQTYSSHLGTSAPRHRVPSSVSRRSVITFLTGWSGSVCVESLLV